MIKKTIKLYWLSDNIMLQYNTCFVYLGRNRLHWASNFCLLPHLPWSDLTDASIILFLAFLLCIICWVPWSSLYCYPPFWSLFFCPFLTAPLSFLIQTVKCREVRAILGCKNCEGRITSLLSFTSWEVKKMGDQREAIYHVEGGGLNKDFLGCISPLGHILTLLGYALRFTMFLKSFCWHSGLNIPVVVLSENVTSYLGGLQL